MSDLLLANVEVPTFIEQLPSWLIVLGLLLNAFKDSIPFLSELAAKKQLQKEIDELKVEVIQLKTDLKGMSEKYDTKIAEYNELLGRHHILLNRIEVLMQLDPGNEALTHIVPKDGQ